jgi:hypothetical protein
MRSARAGDVILDARTSDVRNKWRFRRGPEAVCTCAMFKRCIFATGACCFRCVVCFAEFERAMISSPAQVARVLVAANCPAIRMSKTS